MAARPSECTRTVSPWVYGFTSLSGQRVATISKISDAMSTASMWLWPYDCATATSGPAEAARIAPCAGGCTSCQTMDRFAPRACIATSALLRTTSDAEVLSRSMYTCPGFSSTESRVSGVHCVAITSFSANPAARRIFSTSVESDTPVSPRLASVTSTGNARGAPPARAASTAETPQAARITHTTSGPASTPSTGKNTAAPAAAPSKSAA